MLCVVCLLLLNVVRSLLFIVGWSLLVVSCLLRVCCFCFWLLFVVRCSLFVVPCVLLVVD